MQGKAHWIDLVRDGGKVTFSPRGSAHENGSARFTVEERGSLRVVDLNLTEAKHLLEANKTQKHLDSNTVSQIAEGVHYLTRDRNRRSYHFRPH